LTLEKFDGTTPLSIFLNHLDACAKYNGWDVNDKASHLRVSLKGNAAYIIDDENLEGASYQKLIKRLKIRCGTESQSSLYCSQMRTRKRGKEEPLQTWYHDINCITRFDILLINGKVFHLIPGEKSDSCRRVVATEKVVVPARSQAIVPCRVEMTRMTSDANDGHSVWTTEVSEIRNGVNVARALLPERLDNLPILVLNSSDQACEIHADTILTEL